ncbi:hypothetical protein FRC10_000188 [Ceratobasidium sp. 414]|nr:hypothetical protein FRC10_000188 [Ceratobasidium sp. 414]
MSSRRTTPSPTLSRGLTIPMPNFWTAQPSPTETAPEREIDKDEAKRRSDVIDQALRTERIARTAARRKQRKVLLLGELAFMLPESLRLTSAFRAKASGLVVLFRNSNAFVDTHSESGKSTLVKQFRLMQSPEAFAIERESWKSIVFLNVIRSILRLVDFVAPHFNLHNPQDPESQSFARLRLRLMPLRSIEASIVESLSSPRQVAQTRVHNFISPTRASRSSHTAISRSNSPELEDEPDDVYAHPESRWQRVLHKCMRVASAVEGRASTSQRSEVLEEEDDGPAVTLRACAADMKEMWTCCVIQEHLKEHGLFMEEQSGFFLNDIERITARGYVPTDDDILRTRVKTIAPTEIILHHLEPGLEWRLCKFASPTIYPTQIDGGDGADDVGGARRQRAKWAPLFDDVDLIILLAPVSAFDQQLAEDKSINRLRDSFDLWTELCQTKALHHIPILLFLNKCDLLDKKLKAGVRLGDFLLSYADKPNETKKVLHYLSKRFAGLRKDSTAPSTTPYYIHHTSVVVRVFAFADFNHPTDLIFVF